MSTRFPPRMSRCIFVTNSQHQVNDFGVTEYAVRSLAATKVVKRLTVGPVAVIDLTVGGSTFVASASGNSTVQYRSTQHAVHVIGSTYKSYVFRTFPFI